MNDADGPRRTAAPRPQQTLQDRAPDFPDAVSQGLGQAIEVAQALAALLRPILPALALSQEGEVPWSPLLLEELAGEPTPRHRLVLGPAPMDERRLVAALQARPLALSGPARGVARTGDAFALAHLGPLWRGNLLGLLRAAHVAMDARRAPTLSLITLAHLLLVSGAPVSPDALARLGLGLPVELSEEATATLLSRARAVYEHLPLPAAPCSAPAIGRIWADAVRDLLPQSDRERFQAHADTCDRCAQSCPPGGLSSRRCERQLGRNRPTGMTNRRRHRRRKQRPNRLPLPDPSRRRNRFPPCPATRQVTKSPRPRKRRPETINRRRPEAIKSTATASATSPTPAAPLSTVMNPTRWFLIGALLLLLVCAFFGIRLTHR